MNRELREVLKCLDGVDLLSSGEVKFVGRATREFNRIMRYNATRV